MDDTPSICPHNSRNTSQRRFAHQHRPYHNLDPHRQRALAHEKLPAGARNDETPLDSRRRGRSLKMKAVVIEKQGDLVDHDLGPDECVGDGVNDLVGVWEGGRERGGP